MHHLVIRADATTITGTGHIMRCIALAQAWHDRGGEVTFLSHCDSNALGQRILSKGFRFISVERPHPNPNDLRQTLGLLQEAGRSGSELWLVLDGYHFDPSYQETVRRNGFRLLVIDDYNHQPHYHADILLNQNIWAQRQQYACDWDTVLLLGTKYVLLRNEFLAQKRQRREQPVIARKLLVTLGGADPDNVMLVIVQALKRVYVRGLEVKIVVGPSNPHFEILEREIQRDRSTEGAMQIVRNGDMPKLMAWADAAVSAGGGTCWELAFMGVPFLVLSLAENQRDMGSGLEESGAARYLGWSAGLDVGQLSESLKNLLVDSKQREEMSSKATKLVDGEGAKRITSFLYWLDSGSSVAESCIRKAAPEDACQIWRLSNDEDVRRNSFNTDPITLETHLSWYEAKLASLDTAFYVLDVSGVIGAQIRYEREGDAAVVSFSVPRAFRGRHLGGKLIELTFKSACEELGVSLVHGKIKSSNKASIRTFLRVGFHKSGEGMTGACNFYVFEKACNKSHRLNR